jgi:hypothetical protein
MFVRPSIGRRVRRFAFRAGAGVALAFALIVAPCLSARAGLLDGGVDPANLGKGDWIYVLSQATNHLGGVAPAVHDLPSLMSFYKATGFDYVIVKAGTGSVDFNGGFFSPQFDSNLVWQAHAAGLRIFGYTRSLGADVPGEIRLASRVYALGGDGFVIDAESEWEADSPWIGTNGPAFAIQLCSGIKTLWPTKFLAHAPMPIISIHPTFPYKEFGLYCDAVMPQAYWHEFRKSPADTVDWMSSVWVKFQDSLQGNDTNAIKPLAPIGQADDPAISGAQIREFFDRLKTGPHSATAGGYHGCSFWRADARTPGMWTAIVSNSIAAPATNPPVIWNVALDDLTDTSATIAWATDVPADSIVDYGPTAGYGTLVTNPTPATAHAVQLTGLTPGTTYHYRMTSQGTSPVRTVSWDCLFTTYMEGRVSDIVLDCTSAAMTGLWNTGSSAGGKLGASYHYKRQGGGSEYVQFTPNILAAGVYEVCEWHPSGRNRAQSAPHVITSESGTQTVLVNQEIQGGRWNSLGTFAFAAGTEGNVRITDGFTGPTNEVVVADAIKFVHVQPVASVAAPSLFPRSLLQVTLASGPRNLPPSRETNHWKGWPDLNSPTTVIELPPFIPDGPTNNPAYDLRLNQ